jgi:hypothetical protein
VSGVVELDYTEGRGPGIPDLSQPPRGSGAPPPREPPEPSAEERQLELAAFPGWEQGTVEQFLKGTGAGIHMLVGVSERDWLMTEKDLERIGAPLTRILNRYEPAVRLSPYADPLLVAHGFGIYGWRSALERQRALRDAKREAEAGDGYQSASAPAPAPSANGAGPAAHGDVGDVGDGIPEGIDLEGPTYFDTRGGEQ